MPDFNFFPGSDELKNLRQRAQEKRKRLSELEGEAINAKKLLEGRGALEEARRPIVEQIVMTIDGFKPSEGATVAAWTLGMLRRLVDELHELDQPQLIIDQAQMEREHLQNLENRIDELAAEQQKG